MKQELSLAVVFFAMLAMVPSAMAVEPGVAAASDATSLHQEAVDQALRLVGAKYLDGGKGYDYLSMKYADAGAIRSGYLYYNNVTESNQFGKGVDCSGLVMWSYNKAYGATKSSDPSNPIYCEGAAGQWSDQTRFQQKSTSIPTKDNLTVGDLLFIGTKNAQIPDHVGMYVGDGNIIHSRGDVGVEIQTLDDWLNLSVSGGKKYRDRFTGYGSVITNRPSGTSIFSVGDEIEVQNTLEKGLVIRDLQSDIEERDGRVYNGARGIILDGPRSASLKGVTYTWWKVQWHDGQLGWSAEGYPGGVYYFKKVAPTTGTISVTSNPAGVSVYLDGSYSGTTPVTLCSVRPGVHTVRLACAGYQDSEDFVQVDPGQSVYINQAMYPEPIDGGISFTTTPQGASVYLDGSYKGTTPLILGSMSPGFHPVKFSLSGYEEHEISVQVVAGQTREVGVEMDPVSVVSGTLSIHPRSSTLTVGQIQTFTILLDTVPAGLAQFNATVALLDQDPGRLSPPIGGSDGVVPLANSSIGEIVEVSYPAWAGTSENNFIPGDVASVRAIDRAGLVGPGATDVVLCTLTVRGDAPGTTSLMITPREVDDDRGGRYIFDPVQILVQVEPLPGGMNSPGTDQTVLQVSPPSAGRPVVSETWSSPSLSSAPRMTESATLPASSSNIPADDVVTSPAEATLGLDEIILLCPAGLALCLFGLKKLKKGG